MIQKSHWMLTRRGALVLVLVNQIVFVLVLVLVFARYSSSVISSRLECPMQAPHALVGPSRDL